MSLKVLLLACRQSGFETARAILDSDHELTAVVTADFDGQVNDGYDVSDFKALLEGSQTLFIETKNVNEPSVIDRLRAVAPDVGISMGWRRLVRQKVLEIPRLGCINFHTSDLPRYRGFASTSWAIFNGDKQTAITAHQMLDGVADEGDILKKHFIDITGATTIATLFEEVFEGLRGCAWKCSTSLMRGQPHFRPNYRKRQYCLFLVIRLTDGLTGQSPPLKSTDSSGP